MTLEFSASVPCGTVTAPPSKSHAHRLLLCAALASGESTIENLSDAADLSATLACLRTLGAQISSCRGGHRPPALSVRGFDPFSSPAATLPCLESASTLRFLLPLCLLSGQPMTLTGTPRLLERPLSVYAELCRARGLRYEKTDAAVTVQGPLLPGRFELPGDVSSQFVSGLLFALPLLRGDSTLRLLPPVESRPYIEMTLAVLAEAGIEVRKKAEDFYEIPGNQRYSPFRRAVEGDWSNAAPFFVLQALGYDVSVAGLDPDSPQGDKVCPALLDALRQGFAVLDLSDCPDLGPVLFTTAAMLHGGRFLGIRRLRDKESDRVSSMQTELAKLGAKLTVSENALTVHPAVLHAPAVPLDSHNDHRVAMALSLPLLRCGGTLIGADCVRKSWPDYFDALRRLGVRLSTNH